MGGLGLEDGLLRDMQWVETDLRTILAEQENKGLNAESCTAAFGMNLFDSCGIHTKEREMEEETTLRVEMCPSNVVVLYTHSIIYFIQIKAY